MWCVKCGQKIEDNSSFCCACGADLREVNQEPQVAFVDEQGVQEPAVYGFFKSIFSSNLFLVACILATVYAAAGILNFTLDVVLDILCAISFWLLRQSALDNKVSGYITPLKILSVSSTITWVFNWVAVGLVGLAGLIMMLFANLLTGESFVSIIEAEELPAAFLSLGWTIIGIVFVVIAVAVALLNIFCFSNFRRCAKSFVVSAENGVVAIEKFSVVKAWLLVNAILELVSFVSDISSMSVFQILGAAASAGFFFVLFLWADGIIKEKQI